MGANNDLVLLLELENRIFSQIGERKEVDVKGIAAEAGLDMDDIMKEVAGICGGKKYRVGGHVYCIRHNVIPQYIANGELILDRDHCEGIRRILAVARGICPDY